MHPTMDESAQAAAMDFASRIVPFWQAELGSELLGAYLIGSLAHGGFTRRYSDIDMALVTEAGLPRQALDRVRSQAAALSADWGSSFPCSGPIGTSVSADFLHWIASIISIMRLCWPSGSVCGRRDPRWKRFSITWRERHLRAGQTRHGASRPLIFLSRKIAKRTCGRSSIPHDSAMAG